MVRGPCRQPGAEGNHFYGVTALGPNDVWAVTHQRLTGAAPDQPLVEHWNGTAWSVVSTPSLAAGTNALYSVTVNKDGVFAAGESDDEFSGAHPLVERFSAGSWSILNLPEAGSIWTNLRGIAAGADSVWAVGTFLDPASGNQQTLTLRGDSSIWTVVNGPNPGSGNNVLGGVDAVGDQFWAAGLDDQGGSNQTFIERHSA